MTMFFLINYTKILEVFVTKTPNISREEGQDGERCPMQLRVWLPRWRHLLEGEWLAKVSVDQNDLMFLDYLPQFFSSLLNI